MVAYYAYAPGVARAETDASSASTSSHHEMSKFGIAMVVLAVVIAVVLVAALVFVTIRHRKNVVSAEIAYHSPDA